MWMPFIYAEHKSNSVYRSHIRTQISSTIQREWTERNHSNNASNNNNKKHTHTHNGEYDSNLMHNMRLLQHMA